MPPLRRMGYGGERVELAHNDFSAADSSDCAASHQLRNSTRPGVVGIEKAVNRALGKCRILDSHLQSVATMEQTRPPLHVILEDHVEHARAATRVHRRFTLADLSHRTPRTVSHALVLECARHPRDCDGTGREGGNKCTRSVGYGTTTSEGLLRHAEHSAYRSTWAPDS